MRRKLFAIPAIATLVIATAVPAQEAKTVAASSLLQIISVSVTPTSPAVDTLCQLRLVIKNAGDRIVSQLAFSVTVEGHELPVYRNQIFMERVEPGAETEVRLYNFWSTETGRPAPTDDTFDVAVELTEAHWYTIEDQEDAEVWTPLEPVGGLPVAFSVSLAVGAGD